MTRTLIVGARSPLGRLVYDELRTVGHEVVRAGRQGDDPVQLDVGDRAQVRRVVGDVAPTDIVYLVRPSTGPGRDPDSAVAAADLAHVVETASTVGTRRVVFASSAAVYGDTLDHPARETDPVPAPSAYGALKLASESALAAAGHASAVETAALRFFNLYGPGFGSSLVNRLALGERPVVQLDAPFVRDYLHARDAAGAIRHTLELDRLPHPVVNVGTGVATSNTRLQELFPDVPSDGGSGPASYSVADVDRLRNAWGFAATISLDDVAADPWSHLQ